MKLIKSNEKNCTTIYVDLFIHHPTNKKPRLNSKILRLGYETDLSPQLQTPIKLNKAPIRL